MVADLNVNYAATRDVGTQVSTKGEEFSQLLNAIKAVNQELASYWEGQDSSKYSGAVAEQAVYMEQLASTVDEIGKFLVQVGNAYEEAMQNNQDAIQTS